MAKKVEVKTTEVEVVEPDTTQNDKVEEKTVVKEKKAKQEKVKADKNSKNQKKGKNVKEKRGLGKRLKESMSELKKVSWPTFGHTVKQTGVVITVVAICTLALFGFDRLFGWLYTLLTGI